MATTELAVREQPASNTLSNEQLKYIAATEFVPKGLRGNLPAILACVATGRAIGIDDMSAIRSIHIIDGKASFSAELMVMLVRRAGHSIQGEIGEGSATVTGKRADNGDVMTCTWTLEMAKRAGLAGKDNWKKYPESMLWARAVSQLARMLFPDCFAGATYTTEELGDGDTGPDGAPPEEPYDDGLFPPLDSAGEPGGGDGASAPQQEAPPQSPVPRAAAAGEPASPAEPPTPAMVKKLNVLVGKLREAGRIETFHLYKALNRPAVVGEDGELHWSPLRDLLTKGEALELLDRLSQFEAGSGFAERAERAQAARAGATPGGET